MVLKSSGEKQAFSSEKLKGSLLRSGATEELAQSILEEILDYFREETTTKEIYRKAFQLLRKNVRGTAARYSLKNAIMELGPSGYPFEQFVGELFRSKGYTVDVSQIIQGCCITHEVDVVARNGNKKIIVECKYHNSQGAISNVKVPLYIHARFNDIIKNHEATNPEEKLEFEGWIVTNTRFSDDAATYGRCAGLNLIAWDYPKEGSLKQWVEKTGYFPVTVLTNLTKSQKQQLINSGIILCKHLLDNKNALAPFGLSEKAKAKIFDEIKELIRVS